MIKQYFCYSTPYVALTAVVGNVNNVTISIGADADFELTYLTAAVEQATILVANWSGLVQITDSAVGRAFFDQNAGVPLMCVTGTGAQPYVLLTPRLVRSNSSLNIQLTQRQAVATNVCIVLNGYKLLPE
jgi:hypothetical protein